MKHVRIGISGMTAVLLALVILFCPAGLAAQSDMPFNGEIAFHKISLTIPDSYIRDSTQSTADFWVFEKGFYSRYIMLSRNDLQGDADEALDRYAESLHAEGVDAQRTRFLQAEAVYSESVQADTAWREMFFVHDGSLYAVAMRGGTADEMQALLDTVALHAEIPEIAVQPDNRNALERFFGYFFGK